MRSILVQGGRDKAMSARLDRALGALAAGQVIVLTGDRLRGGSGDDTVLVYVLAAAVSRWSSSSRPAGSRTMARKTQPKPGQ